MQRQQITFATILGAAFTLVACQEERPIEQEPAPAAEERAADARPMWRNEAPAAELDDILRYDRGWRDAPSVDSVFSIGRDSAPVLPADSAALASMIPPDSLFDIPESWEDLGADSVWDGERRIHLPLGGRVEGPSVLALQVLLDRAGFSPGVLDGRWGANVERAVFWLQRREGLRPTGSVDSVTLSRIEALAGAAPQQVGTRVLRAEDVEGPFTSIPEDVYARAELECLCPESALELVAERAHTTPEVLRQLNPGRTLDSLAAGDSLRLPLVGAFAAREAAGTAVGPAAAPPGPDSSARGSVAEAAPPSGPPAQARVTRIVISDRGRYLHAFDAEGRLLHHAPATLGSDYNPSPAGTLEVTSVTFDPWFHYQPELLEGADPDNPDTRLPPGPNSPVGTVWIALSREHYGIHGTSAPATIGYVTSSGCVRLTNWDAERLARLVSPGTTVEFRDTRPEAAPDTLR